MFDPDNLDNLNSSSSSSSSDDEMDFEDLHTINLMKNQINEIKSELDKNPYLYEKHVMLIDLLRKLKDSEELRKARDNMKSIYPLTEELWLQWIREDETFDEYLFKLALKDYISIDIWIEYAYFAMKCLSDKNGDNIVRAVFEDALTHVGVHPTKGFIIWEAYREFETAMLQSIQPPIGSIATPDQIKKSDEITKKIEKLYTRQLAIPLINIAKTFEEYKSFISSNSDELVTNSYNKAFAYWQEIQPFEDKLNKITSSNIEVYKEYIDFELAKNQPIRIQNIFERAIKDNCLDASLWVQYISYMTKLGIETLLLPVHERAVRNCPWSVQLWVKYLLSLERFNHSEEKVKAIFNEALQSGFALAIDYLNLWMVYVDMLRRKIVWSSENHQESLTMLRTTLEKAIGQLFESYGREGDPNCTLQQYWAFIEAKYCKNIPKARELWIDIMQSGFGDKATIWLEYISIERSFGDVKHCRKVFQRAINSVSDWPENICEAYITFERLEGNLQTYEEAVTRVEAQLKRKKKKVPTATLR